MHEHQRVFQIHWLGDDPLNLRNNSMPKEGATQLLPKREMDLHRAKVLIRTLNLTWMTALKKAQQRERERYM